MRPDKDVDIDLILSHFQHVIDLAGDEHVSFGTDFDGTEIPDVVQDATGLPVVLREMKRRGYSDDRLERICNGNFLRVMKAVWRE
jgi:membrane dipeptidase